MESINITSAQYHNDPFSGVAASIRVTIDGKTLLVPLDPANRHYQAITEWASQDGNSIQDAD